MTYREAAVRIAATQRGVHEIDGSNWGPRVKEYLAAAGLSFPAAWCAAFLTWCFEVAGLKLDALGLTHEAGVGFWASWARKTGNVVKRPRRGDCGAWELDGPKYQWGDHIFIVRRALSIGTLGALVQSWEGNTSTGVAGSQSDGGIVARRTRFIRHSSVVWIRVPGERPANLGPLRRPPRVGS